jgi:AcrR family transcriptional regulator
MEQARCGRRSGQRRQAASNPAPTRHSERANGRAWLIEAAMAEFATHGLVSPSLDAICARAGYTRGAFYVHFRDREDLVAAVMERALGAFLDAIIATGEAGRDLERTVRRFEEAVAGIAHLRAASRGREGAHTGVPFHRILEACERSPQIRGCSSRCSARRPNASRRPRGRQAPPRAQRRARRRARRVARHAALGSSRDRWARRSTPPPRAARCSPSFAAASLRTLRSPAARFAAMKPTSRRVPLPERGVEIALLDWGGDGPLVFMHHANGFCAGTLGLVASGLVPRFRVIGMDARPAIRRSLKSRAYAWPNFAADYLAVAERLADECGGGRVAAGLGHSFGGTSALGAAARRSELFERLVLVDPVMPVPELTAHYRDDPERMARVGRLIEGARKRRSLWSNAAEAREHFASRSLFANWLPAALDLYIEHGLRSAPMVSRLLPRRVE